MSAIERRGGRAGNETSSNSRFACQRLCRAVRPSEELKERICCNPSRPPPSRWNRPSHNHSLARSLARLPQKLKSRDAQSLARSLTRRRHGWNINSMRDPPHKKFPLWDYITPVRLQILLERYFGRLFPLPDADVQCAFPHKYYYSTVATHFSRPPPPPPPRGSRR